MKRFRLTELPDNKEGHFLKGVIPGDYICKGAMNFKKPGDRSHSHDGPGGSDVHIHDGDHEVFVILQGKAVMELNEEKIPLSSGDVFVVEPGENHHLVADMEDPCINLYIHAGPERSEKQVA